MLLTRVSSVLPTIPPSLFGQLLFGLTLRLSNRIPVMVRNAVTVLIQKNLEAIQSLCHAMTCHHWSGFPFNLSCLFLCMCCTVKRVSFALRASSVSGVKFGSAIVSVTQCQIIGKNSQVEYPACLPKTGLKLFEKCYWTSAEWFISEFERLIWTFHVFHLRFLLIFTSFWTENTEILLDGFFYIFWHCTSLCTEKLWKRSNDVQVWTWINAILTGSEHIWWQITIHEKPEKVQSWVGIFLIKQLKVIIQ